MNAGFFFITSGCQTVWIQIRPHILPGLIWVKTVCKGYQQMTTVATSGQRVNTEQLLDTTLAKTLAKDNLIWLQLFFLFGLSIGYNKF